MARVRVRLSTAFAGRHVALVWRASLALAAALQAAAAPSMSERGAASTIGSDPAVCTLTTLPLDTRVDGQSIYVLWEEPDDARLWQAFDPVDPRLRHYRVHVSHHVDPDPTLLMQRQQALLRRYGFRDRNLDTVLAGKAGTLQPVECLELLLLSEHLSRRGHEAHEFIAVVMRHPEYATLRLHFQSFEGAAWVAPYALSAALTDTTQGWYMVQHLRSRSFDFRDPIGDVGGTLVPSSQFVRWYRILANDPGLREARITNGFDTATFTNDDLYTLSTDYP